MGGLGSGIPGGAGDGVYIRIVADADEAAQKLSKLDGTVDYRSTFSSTGRQSKKIINEYDVKR